MMTLHEAMQRLGQNRMGMRRYGSLSWMIYFLEDRIQGPLNTYITDDLDDAVIEASKMRSTRKFVYA